MADITKAFMSSPPRRVAIVVARLRPSGDHFQQRAHLSSLCRRANLRCVSRFHTQSSTASSTDFLNPAAKTGPVGDQTTSPVGLTGHPERSTLAFLTVSKIHNSFSRSRASGAQV